MSTPNMLKIHNTLLKAYDSQDWWPAKTTHKKWEMCAGAILTQNTAWKNVNKALENLIKANAMNPEKIANMPLTKLQKLVKPSGFYKQKANRLRRFAKFVLSFGSVKNFCKNITREQLLSFNGIGQETADSILLYACNKPYFVIDAYTKRIFTQLGIKPDHLKGSHKHDYEQWRTFFEQNIINELQNNKMNDLRSKSSKDLVRIYKEYHALIVELAKRNCKTKPQCNGCVLNQCPSKTKTNSV